MDESPLFRRATGGPPAPGRDPSTFEEAVEALVEALPAELVEEAGLTTGRGWATRVSLLLPKGALSLGERGTPLDEDFQRRWGPVGEEGKIAMVCSAAHAWINGRPYEPDRDASFLKRDL